MKTITKIQPYMATTAYWNNPSAVSCKRAFRSNARSYKRNRNFSVIIKKTLSSSWSTHQRDLEYS